MLRNVFNDITERKRSEMKFLPCQTIFSTFLLIVSILLFVRYKIMYLAKLYYRYSLVVCRVLVRRTLS